MTPAARIATAAVILDEILAGVAAEQALLRWARSSRYAGSKDRAAVRDHVFDALRCRRSFAVRGGSETGRGLMIGLARDRGLDLDQMFSGEGHGPAPLTAAERAAGRDPTGAEALDCPDWLLPRVEAALGPQAAEVLRLMRDRAPLFLRTKPGHRDTARSALAADGIEAQPHWLVDGALEVVSGARKVKTSAAWRDGLVEVQDVGSQAVCDLIPVPNGPILDFCAGGGGKSLALAARGGEVFAHDANTARMGDIPDRAERAGVTVPIVQTASLEARGPFDLVVADVPCSGSGAWRRQPEAKWRLTPEDLADLVRVQAQIMDQCACYLAKGGELAYVTCSLLTEENDQQVNAFLKRTNGFQEIGRHRFDPRDGSDGFFLSRIKRELS